MTEVKNKTKIKVQENTQAEGGVVLGCKECFELAAYCDCGECSLVNFVCTENLFGRAYDEGVCDDLTDSLVFSDAVTRGETELLSFEDIVLFPMQEWLSEDRIEDYKYVLTRGTVGKIKTGSFADSSAGIEPSGYQATLAEEPSYSEPRLLLLGDSEYLIVNGHHRLAALLSLNVPSFAATVDRFAV